MEEKFEPIIKKEIYKLEDKDFLLIQAINNLTSAINRLVSK